VERRDPIIKPKDGHHDDAHLPAECPRNALDAHGFAGLSEHPDDGLAKLTQCAGPGAPCCFFGARMGHGREHRRFSELASKSAEGGHAAWASCPSRRRSVNGHSVPEHTHSPARELDGGMHVGSALPAELQGSVDLGHPKLVEGDTVPGPVLGPHPVVANDFRGTP
jgi:hypothetical protein